MLGNQKDDGHVGYAAGGYVQSQDIPDSVDNSVDEL